MLSNAKADDSAGHPQELRPRTGLTPRFTEELKLPISLEEAFRNFWRAHSRESAPGYIPALASLSQTWLWLKTSPDAEARKLRELVARIYDDEQNQLAPQSGAAGKMCRDTTPPPSALARMEKRDVELLDTLRGFQNGMQQLAAESDAIRRLRQIVAPDHMEEVLDLVKRINL